MVFIEYLAVGIAGSLALVIAAKVIMAKLLQRDTDYYKESDYPLGNTEDGGAYHD